MTARIGLRVIRFRFPSSNEMEHFFGKSGEGMGAGERLCNEPIVPGAVYTRVYHAHYVILPNGDAECRHCPQTFSNATREPDGGSHRK